MKRPFLRLVKSEEEDDPPTSEREYRAALARLRHSLAHLPGGKPTLVRVDVLRRLVARVDALEERCAWVESQLDDARRRIALMTQPQGEER